MTTDIAQQIATANETACLCYEEGQFEQAATAARQACELARQHLGPQSFELATSLDNLATACESLGRYEEAKSLYHEAINIFRGRSDTNPLELASTLNNMALLCLSSGDTTTADRLLQEAHEICIARGERDLFYAVVLNSMGLLYQSIRDYSKALAFMEESLRLRQMLLGDEHPMVLRGLNNLADTARTSGNAAQAVEYLKAILDLQRVQPDEPPGNIAVTLNNLAAAYRVLRKHAAAADYQREALTIWRGEFEGDHPLIATALNNLALTLKEIGNDTDEEVEALYEQALTMRQRCLGPEHPDVGASLHNLGMFYASQGRAGEAFQYLYDAATIDDHLIGDAFLVGSERQRRVYLKRIRSQVETLLSLLLRFPTELAAVHPRAFDIILRRKGLSAEALFTQQAAILGGRYPHLVPKLKEWHMIRAQLAHLIFDGAGTTDPDRYQQTLVRYETQRETVEIELARQIPEMRMTQRMRQAATETVAHALPADSVLIEFLRTDLFVFEAHRAGGETNLAAPHYVAFVVPAGHPEQVRFLDLGLAEPVDAAIAAWHATIRHEATRDGERHVGPASDAQRTTAAPPDIARPILDALRQQLIAPLQTLIAGYSNLIIAPDGNLARLPFALLPLDTTRTLIDAWCISYVTTGREILRMSEQREELAQLAQPPLVIADPDFDWHLLQSAQPATEAAAIPRPRDVPWFTRLPGARLEGEWVARHLGVPPILGAAAVKDVILQCRSPRILHIASHGFFLPPPDPASAAQSSPGSVTMQPKDAEYSEGPRIQRLQARDITNPLLQSGLALAGANTWNTHATATDDGQDTGILTAEDVMQLDLRGTELVVLSACETALGEMSVGEGVQGLQRAFFVAGAHRLVMSLWRIPDHQTYLLMTHFYRHLHSGLPCAEALRQAQRFIRADYPDWFGWGAFVLQGDPRALQLA